MAFLRWNKGRYVSFFLPCRAVANDVTGHVPKFNPVPKKDRRKLEVVIARDLIELIHQGKVIRVCNTTRKKKAGVRINEKYANSVLNPT